MAKASVAIYTALTVLACAAQARADVYVGSWEVDQGPGWGSGPPAYTGQQAAALLFGGTAADYAISTVGSNPADINDMTWISTYGVPHGEMIADNSVVSSAGFYANDGDQSAYVSDNAVGPMYTNYAFLVSAPEPASLTVLGAALAGIGLIRRKRRT